MGEHYVPHFIGGEWVDSSDGARIAVTDPATAEPLGEAARATAGDVDRAVAAARECVEQRRLTDIRPADRGRMLGDMARWIREHAAEIAPLLTRGSGKTLQESGFGREKGRAALANYYHLKNVAIRRT